MFPPKIFLRVLALSLLLADEFGTASAAQFYNAWVSNRFAAFPTQSGPTNNPDGDADVNLVEFAFGTDPAAANGGGSVIPKFGALTDTNGIFSVEIFERLGHQPGAQIDLWLAAKPNATNWFRPWWLRVTTNSQPGDPAGSVRENFSTRLPGTNAWFVRPSVTLLDAGITNATYYVATNGSDSNAGTSNAPYATLNKAASVANAGNLIYVRGGTFNFSAQASLSRSGSSNAPIRVRAFPGEHPVLDFTAEPVSSAGISLSGNWWWLYGLEIAHAGHNGIKITGVSNIVEFCAVHESGDTGIQLTTCAYNLILNCDSYLNYDSPIGGNADGFGCKFVMGPGNVFRGCRSWFNSDDGWDFWQATNMIVIDHCMTFSNGFNVYDNPATNIAFNGNGNGFKLGGNYYYGPHFVTHCVSFGNRVNGFDQNNNNAGQTVDNCTSWNNGSANFNLNHGTNITPHVIRNNLSFAGHSGDSFRSGSLLTNNSWQAVSPAPATSDVLGVDTAAGAAPRRDDGSLPELLFLRPVPTGRLINKGVKTGETYNGSAPDLGAYETSEW